MSRLPLLLRIAIALLPAEERDEIGGDLTENYLDHRVRRGALAARLWLVRHLATLPLWLLIERFQTRGTPAGSNRHSRNGDSFMRSRTQEFRTALRAYLRTPGFSLIAVLTLALGIAANSSVYSVVDGILLEGLPYADSDELVFIGHTAPGIELPVIGTATGLQQVYQAGSRSAEVIGTFVQQTRNVSGGEAAPIRASSIAVDREFFEVLGVDVAMGRGFAEEEDLPGGPQVMILSHAFWQSYFGGDRDVLGRTVQANGIGYEIIGVMGQEFGFPNRDVQIILPLGVDPNTTNFGGFNVQGIARLTDDATAEVLQAELNGLFPVATERFADINMEQIRSAQLAAVVTGLKERIVGPVASALWIVMGTVGLVLVIACANIANLFMARAEGRQKEVAVRTAMGAGRGDLFWQYSVEAGVLALASGVLGLLMAWGGVKLLVANAPEGLPRIDAVGIDGSVVLFTVLVSLGSAFVFAALPMLRHALQAPGTALRDGTRGSTSGRRTHRGRQLLVASQVAFALILLVGSGLMLRSFERLRGVELGFEPESVLTFQIALPSSDYPDQEQAYAAHRSMLDRIAAVPGVTSVGSASRLPIAGNSWSADPLNREEAPLEPNQIPPIIGLGGASSDYFETMGIPIVAGRTFTRADATDRAHVAVVNETLAERFWPGENPIGRQISHGLPGTGEWMTIVGIVGDTPAQSLTEPQQGMVYYSMAPPDDSNVSWISWNMSYTVRTSVPWETVIGQVRAAIAEVDPTLPISRTMSLERHVEDARVQMAFTMTMLSIAALTGLILGAIGIYGVISYLTAMRTREIGVRMALGAEARSVRAMVLRQGAGVALLGLAFGTVGALGLGRFIESILFEVSANDPLTFVAVAATLFLVSMVATYLPAHRAAATAPNEALRQD